MRVAFCLAIGTAIFVGLGSVSQAASILVNTTFGKQCYLATFHSSTPETDQKDIVTCDQATAQAIDDYDHYAALVNRADIRLRMKDFQGAADDSEKAIAMSPGRPSAFINRGAASIGLERYEAAILDLNKAMDFDAPDLQIVFYNRAMAKELLGDIRGAYLDYKKAVEVDPKFKLASDELSRFKVVNPAR
jgi:tetratricopeptide (TPR) repeat protein